MIRKLIRGLYSWGIISTKKYYISLINRAEKVKLELQQELLVQECWEIAGDYEAPEIINSIKDMISALETEIKAVRREMKLMTSK